MANERLNIPKKLKVGFQKRTDTYSGKLAYVVYLNSKNEIAKEKSWSGWIDKKIPVEDYDNEPMEGFVLNKKAGDYNSGWNHRMAKCRVFDPRGFEIEISIDNLLYILQECTSSKGKGLEGEFIYAWAGKDLVLLPTCSPDYEASKKLEAKKEKIGNKDLNLGSAYKGKEADYLVYFQNYFENPYWCTNDKGEAITNYYVKCREFYINILKAKINTFDINPLKNTNNRTIFVTNFYRQLGQEGNDFIF